MRTISAAVTSAKEPSRKRESARVCGRPQSGIRIKPRGSRALHTQVAVKRGTTKHTSLSAMEHLLTAPHMRGAMRERRGLRVFDPNRNGPRALSTGLLSPCMCVCMYVFVYRPSPLMFSSSHACISRYERTVDVAHTTGGPSLFHTTVLPGRPPFHAPRKILRIAIETVAVERG